MSQRVIVPWLMGKSSNGPVSRSDTPTDSSDVVLKDYDDGYNNAGLEVTSEFVGVANRELINRELVNLENAAVNIDNSSDVIIGPVTQFNVNGNVTIYQNKDEQAIGIENKSDTDNGALNDQLARQQKEDQDVTFSTKKKFTLKLYLGIIFLLLILSGITVILVFVLRKNTQPPFEASQGSTTINSSTIENHRLISKAEWNGRPPVKTLPLKLPVGFVIIKHLGSGNVCGSFESCAHKMQTLQVTDISINELDDIYFNFAVGGDGNVYEGRGWDVQPAYTSNNIDIVMLGNFALDEFTPKMINGTKALLEYGLQIGKLASDYKLINHNQTYATLSPGINVIREVKTWPHYDGGLYMGNPLLAGRRGRSKPAF